MTVTLADVAARAGVSAATVSRVLSGNYPVAEATRARVLRAVDDLDYVVNGPASALAAANSDLVGILVNDIADPFFGIMAGAIQAEMGGGPSTVSAGAEARSMPGGGPLSLSGPSLPGAGTSGEKLAVVCNTNGSPARELTYLTLLQRQRAAAVVLTGSGADDPEHTERLAAKVAKLTAAGTRVVLCGRPPVPGALTLTFDNRGGARRLTEHLLTLGHRRIGYIAGPADRTTTRHRLEGHLAALAAHGPQTTGPVRPVVEGAAGAEIPMAAGRARPRRGSADAAHDTAPGGPPLVVHGAYDRASGYDAACELLRREPGITALVAANDTVALGACAALRDLGLRIPHDVSVTGFDDLPFSADAAPALSTVRLPLYEAGARAGRLALGREIAPPGGVAMIRAELMIRNSTAPPPGAAGEL
ncbi:LacI family DNA-binding transcriptional regulator [Streptomyces zagrosensis]|uniref:LacI family transcriptional regulator n=1 Tax=Streptomyces zagrosensis TaxID=1042984 RepID=A0A7W9UXP8_9ACTN|nr:LacI family DNA-binding transcriptional regulator [Streptomyces zagrosensis]MBB5935085.1 LacI family transcriptional regulator [Streptomyces zagrosensis]